MRICAEADRQTKFIGHGSKRIARTDFERFSCDAVPSFGAEEHDGGGDVFGDPPFFLTRCFQRRVSRPLQRYDPILSALPAITAVIRSPAVGPGQMAFT